MNNENLQDPDDPESDEDGLKEETDNKGVSNISNILLKNAEKTREAG